MRNSIKKGLLMISGTLFLVLGVIGIFIPLIPTTPFLLLAAACYIRGSKKFYDRLIKNRWLGEYIKNYQDGKGIPFKVKIITIIVLWLTIIISTILFVSNLIIHIILFIIAIGVTIHIIKIKTLNKKEEYRKYL
jgi:uncharacterized membrane protein YbaN (DUF454 family)